MFKTLNKLQPLVTEKNRCGRLRKVVQKLIDETEGLNLAASKRDALCDGVACTPKTLQSALHTDGIREGWLASGMIDYGSETLKQFLVPVDEPLQKKSMNGYLQILTIFITLLSKRDISVIRNF